MTWKKEKTRRGLSQWTNDAGRFIYVTAVTNTRGENVYQVDSTHPAFYHNAQFFETRDKAMRFAKKFMRDYKDSSPGDVIFNQGVDLRTMRKTRVNIQDYYDDIAMDKYGKLYKQCNNIEKGHVKMLAHQNAAENNLELYGYIVGD